MAEKTNPYVKAIQESYAMHEKHIRRLKNKISKAQKALALVQAEPALSRQEQRRFRLCQQSFDRMLRELA
jgi:hypothetical protein